MTGTNKNITALVVLVSLALSGSLEAAELDTTLRALPMHAATFDIGSKHAISYFLVNDWVVRRTDCCISLAQFAHRVRPACALSRSEERAGESALRCDSRGHILFERRV